MWSSPPNETREYVIQVDIVGADGMQEFCVSAASEKEALAEFKTNGGRFLGEDVHVAIDTNTAKVI